jgi:hypothetical protein
VPLAVVLVIVFGRQHLLATAPLWEAAILLIFVTATDLFGGMRSISRSAAECSTSAGHRHRVNYASITILGAGRAGVPVSWSRTLAAMPR